MKRSDSEFQMCRAHLPTVLNTHNSMELIFNHRFGRMEQQDLVVCDLLALPDPNEQDETDMLETGWLAHDRPHSIHGKNREVFYQSRSTRIDLDRVKRKFEAHTHKGQAVQMKEIFPRSRNDTVWTGMHQMYHQYIQRKGFRDLYNPFEHINKRDSFLVFYIEDLGQLIGFTKIKRYHWHEHFYDDAMMAPEWLQHKQPHSIESVMHCNVLTIGKLTMDMELEWARSQEASYYYAGAGYERSSIYKSDWRGFEWWTGTRWSRSKREYKRLCERDSELKSISDLSDAK
jgi:hypothetical protein